MGFTFTLGTDHRRLEGLMQSQTLMGQAIARWAMMPMEVDFKVVYRPGVIHQNVDASSAAGAPALRIAPGPG